MKTTIVGWLFIATSAVFLFSFLVLVGLPLLSQGVAIENPGLGVLALVLGIYALILGSAVKAHKKWAWYTGTATMVLATLGNLISFVNFFSMALVLPLFLNIFSLYAFISEKELFFTDSSANEPASARPTPRSQ
ncbi:MAG: hypothetical protein ACE5JU_23270 [Candidatus Binatia bacterium]